MEQVQQLAQQVSHEPDEVPVCSICHDDVWCGWKTVCGHIFHGEKCLKPWLDANWRHPTCPMCRAACWPSTVDQTFLFVQFIGMGMGMSQAAGDGDGDGNEAAAAQPGYNGDDENVGAAHEDDVPVDTGVIAIEHSSSEGGSDDNIDAGDADDGMDMNEEEGGADDDVILVGFFPAPGHVVGAVVAQYNGGGNDIIVIDDDD